MTVQYDPRFDAVYQLIVAQKSYASLDSFVQEILNAIDNAEVTA